MSSVAEHAPPVLLVHSSGMSSRQWRALAAALAPSHRVIAPDLLGSGPGAEPWPEGTPFAMDDDLAVLERAIAGLDAPAHVVGHSYGGMLALALARRHPARVRSIAVYDPVAFGVLHDAHDAEGLEDLGRTDGALLVDDARGGREPWMEAFVDYWNGPGAWRALPAPTREAFLRVGRKVFLEVSAILRDRTPRAAYRALEMPVLLLGGAISPPAARRVVALLASAIPHAEVRTIEGAGHMGPITHADVVSAAIAQHLARR